MGTDRRFARAAALLVVGAFVALAVPAVRHWREQPPPPPPAIRLALSMPPGVEPGVGDEPLDAAISPDESEIVFVATRLGQEAGTRQLWRRALDGEGVAVLTGTDGAQQPAWKRTGNVVSFFSGGKLKQVTLGDGAIHDLADASSAGGATWMADGSLLFATGSGPIRRLRNGEIEEATKLSPGDATHAFPSSSGTADQFVYVAVREDGRRVARHASAGDERDLTTTAGHAVLVGNSLLHVRDGALLAYERDLETGRLAARGVPIAIDVGVSAAGRALFVASPNLILHAAASPRLTQIVWLDFAGRRGAAVADPGDYWQVRLAPDDRTVALAVMDPLLRALDIATAPADGGAAIERLTLALAADTDPVWSPDAQRVLFRSMAGGTPDLFARRLRQPEDADELILRSDLDETATDWRGERVLFQARRDGGSDILALDLGTGRTEAVADGAFNETDARWSPDGRWIAYVSDESGRPDVYVRRPDLTRVRVSFGGGRRPRWTRDGRAVLFLRGSTVMRADLTGGQPAGTLFSTAQRLFDVPGIRDFDVAHRSDRLIALLPVAPEQRPAISAIWNWRSLLR